MADKEVYINGTKLGYATSVKGSEETNAETIQTFDGPVTAGMENTPHKIEIESLRYGEYSTYIDIEKIIDKSRSESITVTVKDTIKAKEGKWTKIVHYFDCLLDTNEYEIKADEQTVESLAFISSGAKKEYE